MARSARPGKPCPRCARQMGRYVHESDWKPKPSQSFYYAYWDYCWKCKYLQYYEIAKRYVSRELEPPNEPRDTGMADRQVSGVSK